MYLWATELYARETVNTELSMNRQFFVAVLIKLDVVMSFTMQQQGKNELSKCKTVHSAK